MSRAPMILPLHERLSAAALELADLVTLADRLEGVVSALARRADAALVAECQAADLLTQRLTGLAVFVAGVAAATPAEVLVDVRDTVGKLTLAEQARRLAGDAPSLAEDHAGDVLLFQA